eukprot:NODE_177_length_14091_cov_0.996141.p4 type:complete len:247 gc:universal NODE_177_length_14091_cov_0.996141:1959-1219(-)
MATFKEAYSILQKIHEDLAPKEKEKKEIDLFTVKKRQVGQASKKARALIKQRNETKDPIQTAKLSAEIRTIIKQMDMDIVDMRTSVEKEEKNKKLTDAELDRIKQKKEIISLCLEHSKDITEQDKSRFDDKVKSNKVQLLEQSSASVTNKENQGNGTLPDIELTPDFEEIAKNQLALDEDVNEMSHGVKNLKALAMDMQGEIEKQNVMLTEVDNKVDRAQNKVDNINVKLKIAVDSVNYIHLGHDG